MMLHAYHTKIEMIDASIIIIIVTSFMFEDVKTKLSTPSDTSLTRPVVQCRRVSPSTKKMIKVRKEGQVHSALYHRELWMSGHDLPIKSPIYLWVVGRAFFLGMARFRPSDAVIITIFLSDGAIWIISAPQMQ